ncbi:MAG: hypothetical protein IKR86_01940 [Candidatus Methanomethylophilaceae archaeon]|nr:hypothetical protein [Candidatus Methanomethylophilaceae archaeon]
MMPTLRWEAGSSLYAASRYLLKASASMSTDRPVSSVNLPKEAIASFTESVSTGYSLSSMVHTPSMYHASASEASTAFTSFTIRCAPTTSPELKRSNILSLRTSASASDTGSERARSAASSMPIVEPHTMQSSISMPSSNPMAAEHLGHLRTTRPMGPDSQRLQII